MASEVKTNKVSPSTGTTLSVGDSGDTLALATDAVTGFQVGSDAQGDVLYHDGTDYTRLGAGTSGHFLKTQGTSANPVWAADNAGSLVYLASSRSTVNVATVNFQEFKSTDYLFYQITGFIQPDTAAQLDIRLMDGASAITASDYLYRSAGSAWDGYDTASSTSNNNWTVVTPVSNSASPVMFSFQLHLQDATDDDFDGALLIGNFGWIKNGATSGAERTVFGSYPIDNADIDGVQFYFSSGDVDYHKIAVYGMKGS